MGKGAVKGAKGTMTYGLIGANLLLQKKEESEMYRRTETALDASRLLNQFGTNSGVSSLDTDANAFASWFIQNK